MVPRFEQIFVKMINVLVGTVGILLVIMGLVKGCQGRIGTSNKHCDLRTALLKIAGLLTAHEVIRPCTKY